MFKRLVLLAVVAGLSMGVSCTITTGSGGIITTQKSLDQADAEIVISRAVGVSEATVVADIVDSWGRTIEMGSGQAVLVNSVALSGPSQGQYTVTVAGAEAYTVTVREPTRGEESTTLAAPGDFEITYPSLGGTASLSGFTLRWSNVSDRAQVMIEISQTLGALHEVETFGPFADTGSREITATDLRDFRQGANLSITLTKVDSTRAVAGFGSGELSVGVSVTRLTQPLP